MLAGGVPFLPYLPEALRQVGNQGITWMNRPGLMDIALTFAHFYSGGEKALPILVYGFVPATLFISFDGRRPSRRKWESLQQYFSAPDRRGLWVLLPLLLGVLFLVSQWKPVYVVGRQSILVLIPTVLLIGPLLAQFNRRATLAVFFTLVGLGTSREILRSRTRPETFSDREAATYLADHSSPNDVFLFVGLTAPAIEYYLDRFEPKEDLLRIKFPEEMALHPGWLDEDLLLERRESLVEEARGIGERLKQSMGGTGRSLWVLYDDNHPKTSGILRNEIEERFALREKVDRRSFFSGGIHRYDVSSTSGNEE
jgi:hypothetical protein